MFRENRHLLAQFHQLAMRWSDGATSRRHRTHAIDVKGPQFKSQSDVQTHAEADSH